MKKIVFIIVCLVLIVLFVGLYFHFTYGPSKSETLPDYSREVCLPTPAATPSPTPEPLPDSTPVPTPDVTPEPYVSPIDFQALRERNPDIYAWLDIPGTDISYPLLQSEDDSFYLDHDSDGNWSSYGAVYSESRYNGTDFSDPITVLYGHRMSDGSMFGSLQPLYSDAKSLEQYGLIRVYLPDREIDYIVFAVLPFDSRHIVYNFGGELRYKRAFLYSIATAKGLDVRVNDLAFAEPDDPLLVLSTCLRGNRSNRFLVVAKSLN